MNTTNNVAVAALSPEALAYFLAHARDAGNWSGSPLVGGNVPQTKAADGYLTACKKAGVLTTFVDDGDSWICFTDAGVALAAANGVAISK